MEVPEAYGYSLYGTVLFNENLERLADRVLRIIDSVTDDEDEFLITHELVGLYEDIIHAIWERVPQNPNHKDFNQGHTLGKKFTSWRRVKKGLPQRYRLFFMFRSSAPKAIVYAHFNDDKETRREGDKKHDIYAAFAKRLKSGQVPNTFSELLESAAPVQDRQEEQTGTPSQQ